MLKYTEEISRYFQDENSSEHSYRTSFENMLKEIFSVKDGYFTQQDQKAISGNKPDFVILKDKVPLLYIEVKKVGEDLNKIEKSGQAARYFGYDNLIISDYVNFRFYRSGKKYNEEISLGHIDTKNRTIESRIENVDNLIKTILDFTHGHKEQIKSGTHLAEIMGGKAMRIRDNVLEMLKSDNDKFSDLFKIRNVVKESLMSSIDDDKFADMYAQTLVYGLFAARYNDSSLDNFTRIEARELVPKTNPFLASFFDHIAGANFPDRLAFIVDELCEVFTHADVVKLLHDFYKKEKDNKDPIIHFYEDFLQEYDSKKKMEMGVFYTPRSVVQFIVRAVDEVLKNEFGLSKGLVDTTKIIKKEKIIDTKSKTGKEIVIDKEYHKVQVLDVATGTGTFLNEVIMHVYKSFEGQEGRWKSYVESDLLPRLHGFELMMASYTIAHLKLGMTLHETGAGMINKIIGVYLTNTLDEATEYKNQNQLFGFMDSIAEESKNASRIKSEYPIMCVIGNPPYSGESMNPDYTDNEVYKVEIGGKEKLKERNSKWINDDYVKFIRFGESLIEKNEEGILGMITAHGYIDNPTFRGMRWHLRNTFDKIYVVDLHGNSRKKEVALDGGKDENVFDIMSGVSILIGVKKKSENVKNKDRQLAKVYVHDIYGTRKLKLEKLDNASIENTSWTELPDTCDIWKQEGEGKAEYEKGISVAKLFLNSYGGLLTKKDNFIIGQKLEINNILEDLTNLNLSDDFLMRKYLLKSKDNDKWVFKSARESLCKNGIDTSKFINFSYRNFDDKWVYLDENFVARSQKKLLLNFVKNNICLVSAKQTYGLDFRHIFISNKLGDWNYSWNLGGCTYSPLYLYTDHGEKIPNMNKKIWGEINKILNSGGASEASPEDILDYVYGYLHDKKYREKYNEFLKIDFPRIPYPANKEEFLKYVSYGNSLRLLHLMDIKALEKIDTKITYPISGTDEVDSKYFKYILDENSENIGRVYINETQYFGNVSKEAWEFYIGGYQPAQKYLKDIKGEQLNSDEMDNYVNIIKVLGETYKIVNKFL